MKMMRGKKIITTEKLKNSLNCSDVFAKSFACVSILWLVCCIGLLFPSFRNLVIWFGEHIRNRPLNHPFWHERLIPFGISGIVLYFIFFTVFFYNNFLSRLISNKKDIVFLTVAAIFFVFIIIFRANWVFGDDHEYITTTAVNKYVSIFPYLLHGRFFPLGHIHYNLPLFIFRCLGINTGLPVEAHLALISAFYIVTLLCLYLLFKNREHPVFDLFFVSSFFLLGGSFASVFLHLMYPEAQIIMLFSIFMFMYYKALETDRIKYYICALLAAVYSSYCKEPVFGVFLIIALGNHIFKYSKETKREKIFYMSLIANAVVFLILYYFLSLKNTSEFYGSGKLYMGFFQYLIQIIAGNPIVIIIFLFCFIRLYFILLKKDREHLFHDSLLFAGTAYICAYFLLGFTDPYYFLPAIVLFLPSLVYWVKYLFIRRIAFSLCLFFILIPIYAFNFGYTKMVVKDIYEERQEFIPYVTDLLSLHNNGKEFVWYESDNSILDYSFWLASRDWRKYTANAFLNYLNKTEGHGFFITKKDIDDVDIAGNILFFYPTDNDQYQPMSNELGAMLHDNGFALYKDSYGILIYSR
jgi:hypothetical protein